MEDNNLKNQFSADLLGAVSKVLGEAEQIDEVSSKLARSYLKANAATKNTTPDAKKENRRKGGWNAFAKLHKQPHAKVHATEEVSLDEKHGGADYAIYHKSYTDAVDHALSHHGKSGLSVSDDDRFHHIGLMSKKPSEGNTTTLNLPAKDHATGKDHTIHMQVYNRGGSHPYELNTYSSKNSTQRQIDRVAAKRKKALGEETIEEKRGLWDNIHAKRKRIKAGSGERMRKPGSEGAPTEKDLKLSKEEVELDEKLIGGQAKLDVDKDGKIEKSDFKKLRNKKIAAKVKEAKDCACDDDDKMDEAVYNGHRPTGLPPGQGLPKAQQDALTAKLRDYDAKMDAAKKKFATKEEVELDEGTVNHTDLAQAAHKSYVQATRLGNGTLAAHYLKQHKKHKDLAAKEKAVKEEVELDEGRGRPPKPGSAAYIAQQKAKEAGEAEGPEPDEHIMNQVRKAADSGMMPHKIKYADGSTHALHRVHARAVIAKYNRLKPFAKEEMQAEIAKSHEHMMKHAKD